MRIIRLFAVRSGLLQTGLGLLAGSVIAAVPALHAGNRGSATYSIQTDTIGAGGVSRAQSASYALEGGAVGEFGGGGSAAPVSTSAAYTGKPGYAGTLYNVQGLAVAATPPTVSEGGGTSQLSAAPLLDDNTQLAAVAPASVAWSVLNGPITSISVAGLATTGNVYQNTAAVVQAVYQGRSGQRSLTVVNIGNDDFGTYAGDGIDDDWQARYFGLNNPLASPGVDADGTGQTNLLKFIAGLDPRDPASRFTIIPQSHTGQPGALDITFAPVVSGRTYTLQATLTLGTGVNWTNVPNTTQSDNGTTRTLTDPNATSSGPVKFYRVQITKP